MSLGIVVYWWILIAIGLCILWYNIKVKQKDEWRVTYFAQQDDVVDAIKKLPAENIPKSFKCGWMPKHKLIFENEVAAMDGFNFIWGLLFFGSAYYCGYLLNDYATTPARDGTKNINSDSDSEGGSAFAGFILILLLIGTLICSIRLILYVVNTISYNNVHEKYHTLSLFERDGVYNPTKKFMELHHIENIISIIILFALLNTFKGLGLFGK